MDNGTDNTPPGWLAILDESEAQLAAGQTVSGATVHRALQESIARLEAKAAMPRREATARR